MRARVGDAAPHLARHLLDQWERLAAADVLRVVRLPVLADAVDDQQLHRRCERARADVVPRGRQRLQRRAQRLRVGLEVVKGRRRLAAHHLSALARRAVG